MLSSLYQRNFSKTHFYVLKNQGTTEEAKDIFQEAFIAVWRNIQLDKFHPENETAFAGYLFRVVKNKWIDHLRSINNKKVIPIAEANGIDKADTGSMSEEENLNLLNIREKFKKLGATCREVLTRFYFRKESLRLIASNFNWSEATARNNKYRCIQQLREHLKQ